MGVNFILQGAEEDIIRIEKGTKILQEEWNAESQEKGDIFSEIKINVRFHEGMELKVKCENKGDEFIIYCSSDISSYALFESEDGKLYLSQGLNKTGLFRIYFEIYSQSDWRVISVQLLEENDEELYPGVGIGTDGFPGLSDQLEKEIPEWGLDTYHIAQKYLDLNELDADVIMW